MRKDSAYERDGDTADDGQQVNGYSAFAKKLSPAMIAKITHLVMLRDDLFVAYRRTAGSLLELQKKTQLFERDLQSPAHSTDSDDDVIRHRERLDTFKTQLAQMEVKRTSLGQHSSATRAVVDNALTAIEVYTGAGHPAVEYFEAMGWR